MNYYFPFIHKIKKKKDRLEPLPLYIEQAPLLPPEKPVEEEKDDIERGVVIIQL